MFKIVKGTVARFIPREHVFYPGGEVPLAHCSELRYN
jgi:hypothetical protein